MCLRGTGDEGTEGQCQLRVKKISSAPYKFTIPTAETSSFTVCGILFFFKLKSFLFIKSNWMRHKGKHALLEAISFL